MPDVTLDVGDAVELAELLRFFSGWLASAGEELAGSLTRFVGTDAYGVAGLRGDLDRFTFLLGGSDGEPLFGPDTS